MRASAGLLAGLLCANGLLAAQAPITPVRVCNVLEDLAAYNHKVIAVIGRYSFRQTGRFLSEDVCSHKTGSPALQWRSVLQVSFDEKSAPKPPEHMELDPHAVYRELRAIEQHTALAHIPFGTPDYDRWAVVWGRIEVAREFLSGAAPVKSSSTFAPAPAGLIAVSDTVVMFIEPDPSSQ